MDEHGPWWTAILPFHGGNTGSIPVGRANDFNNLSLFTDFEPMTYGKSTTYLLAFGEHPWTLRLRTWLLTIWRPRTNRSLPVCRQALGQCREQSRDPALSAGPKKFSAANGGAVLLAS
jgi:hypothetical protein